MSKYEQLWIAPHHFRIFATWFRDTRRSQSAKQAKTFDETGSSICHAIPISKLSPTTASYSKAVTSSLFGQERGLVRKVEPSLMGKSEANECNESSLSNCRVQLTLSTKKDGMILEKRLDDFRIQNSVSIRKDYQSPSTPHASYPSPKD